MEYKNKIPTDLRKEILSYLEKRVFISSNISYLPFNIFMTLSKVNKKYKEILFNVNFWLDYYKNKEYTIYYFIEEGFEYINNNKVEKELLIFMYTLLNKITEFSKETKSNFLELLLIDSIKYGYNDLTIKLLKNSNLYLKKDNLISILPVIKNKNISLLKILLSDERINPGNWNNEAIILATKNGYIDIVKLLLNDERVDPNDEYSDTAIVVAVENNHYNIVELLLKDKRVDPSVNDNEALITAYENDNKKIMQLLLKDKRVDPDVLLE